MTSGKPERDDPSKLATNSGQAFLGSKVYGQGFVLTPQERDDLIKKSKRNAQRIFPYLGGQEVNTSPTQDFDRYVISFGEMSLEQAEAWPDLLAIVRDKVKSERDKLKNNADGKRRKAYWWQFGRCTPALDAALAPLSRCLVNSQVTKHLVFAFQPTDRIFGHTLYAYPLDHYAAFAVLQSRIHEPWARLLSSSLEDRLRYAASDCFDTFPFPKLDPRAKLPALERAGEKLYSYREGVLRDCQIGLTQLYNFLKEPLSADGKALQHLRELHENMDRAVLDAYGWEDLHVPTYGVVDRDWELSIIERLYALNAVRAG